MVQDDLRQFVTVRRVLLQHGFRGRPLSLLRLAQRREPHLVVEHLLQLLGRTEIERMAGRFVRLLREFLHPRPKLPALLRQQPRIDQRPRLLHPGQHGKERQLDLLVHAPEPSRGLQPWPERPVEPEGDIRFFRREVRCRLERERREVELLRALAGDVLVARRLELQVLRREGVQAVAARADAVEDVGLEHRVGRDARERNVVPSQDVAGRLQVVPDLAQSRVFQERTEHPKRRREGQLIRPREVVPDRDVGGDPRLHGEGEPRDAGVHVVAPVGMHRKRERSGLAEAVRPVLERRRVRYAHVVPGWRRCLLDLDTKFHEPGLELEPLEEFRERGLVRIPRH